MEAFKDKTNSQLIEFKDTLVWMLGEVSLEIEKRKIIAKEKTT